MPSRTLATRSVAALCSTVLLAGGLAACGTDAAQTSAETSSAAPAAPAAALVLDDGWVKAVDAGGAMPSASPSMTTSPSASPSESMSSGTDLGRAGPMTAMFGTLRNTSDQDLTVTGGSSPAAGVVELHETVRNDAGQLQMQPKQGGFVVPAGGTHELEPGGDHVMLMELTDSLVSGTSTTVTLTTASGDVVVTVPVRSFAGAEESYVPTPSAT